MPSQHWRLLFPRQLRRLPTDLKLVLVAVVVLYLVLYLPVIRESYVRTAVGLVWLLFVPGYAFIAALFPEAYAGDTAEGDSAETSGRGLSGTERVALSFLLSVALFMLVGLVLNVSPWGIRLGSLTLSISVLTIALTVLAAYRRRELPEDERLVVPIGAWFGAVREELFTSDSRRDTALTGVTVAMVILALASVGYVVAFPHQGEALSEMYLLTENESGELVAEGYPTEFDVGESRELIVGVGNHEHQEMRYTVVVELQRVTTEGENVTIEESEELHRFTPTVPANETWHRPHEIQPTMTGEGLRLQYLLYRGSAPETVSDETAYRESRVFIDVG